MRMLDVSFVLTMPASNTNAVLIAIGGKAAD